MGCVIMSEEDKTIKLMGIVWSSIPDAPDYSEKELAKLAKRIKGMRLGVYSNTPLLQADYTEKDIAKAVKRLNRIFGCALLTRRQRAWLWLCGAWKDKRSIQQ